MKKLRVCVLLALVMACLMATTAIAARSLQKGDVTLRLPSGADLIRSTPTPAPEKVCRSHKYVRTSKKAATCNADGYIKYKCANCGATKTETLDATGDHNFSNDKYVKPTCTEGGYSQLKCSTCGKTTREKSVPALGHDFGSWREASRTKLERKCSRCGKTETKANPNSSLLSGAVAVKQTPTPRPYKGHEESKVTPTPKPQIVGKVTATPKAADKTEAKATATPKKKTSSSSGKSTTVYESYDYTAQAGMVEVFTTSGKVNLRKGPGKKNGITNNVPKRGTSLGELLDSDVDASGNVWFKVRYKNKIGWITSDYAEAVPGEVMDSRFPQGNGTELSAYFLHDFAESAEELQLMHESDTEALNDHLMIGGTEYVDTIELYGKDYTVYGVEVGMTAKKAKSMLQKEGFYCSRDASNVIILERPCTPDSISVNEAGFDAYVELVIDGEKCVEAINLYRY